MNQASWVKYYMGRFGLRKDKRKFGGEIYQLSDFVEFNHFDERIHNTVFSAQSWEKASDKVERIIPRGYEKTGMYRIKNGLYLAHFKRKDGKKANKESEVKAAADKWRQQGFKVRVVPYRHNESSYDETYFIYVGK